MSNTIQITLSEAQTRVLLELLDESRLYANWHAKKRGALGRIEWLLKEAQTAHYRQRLERSL